MTVLETLSGKVFNWQKQDDDPHMYGVSGATRGIYCNQTVAHFFFYDIYLQLFKEFFSFLSPPPKFITMFTSELSVSWLWLWNTLRVGGILKWSTKLLQFCSWSQPSVPVTDDKIRAVLMWSLWQCLGSVSLWHDSFYEANVMQWRESAAVDDMFLLHSQCCVE